MHPGTSNLTQIGFWDYLVFFLFIAVILLVGLSFYRKSRVDGRAFTSANGKLPAWVVGMSIFATFVSSISFLGLPGQAYAGNWNPFVFSLSIPFATYLAAKVFIPLYRGMNNISAYSFLEDKMGYWARCYVSVCYILTQIARTGSILLLLALPINSMFGWDIPTIIILTSVVTILFTLFGGISAVIWTDAIQGIILIIGAVICALIITFSMPEGPGQVFSIAAAEGKMSLGSFSSELTTSTFWVVLIYGLFTNMQNYGIDQNYVQRYMTTESTSDAVKSTMFGSLLYIPVSFLFIYIGTALFSYYKALPGILPENIASDMVFPHFITYGLPTGITGLIIASIFSAGISTISTSINSSATVLYSDFAARKKKMHPKLQIKTLYVSSLLVGIAGVGTGLLMMSVDGVLDTWWKLSSIFSGGMLGLFLITLTCRQIKRIHAIISVIVGIAVIAWVSLGHFLPEESIFHSPFHTYLTIVFGTTAIFLTGFILSGFGEKRS